MYTCLMQCTPDITSRECMTCLEKCVAYFKAMYWGSQGGEVSRPSCVFWWDLYSFCSAFDNITIFYAPPRVKSQAQPPANDKKGRSIRYGGIIGIFINLLVFIGLIKFYGPRRKSKNGINVGSAEYSDSDGQFMLRFDLGIIITATSDFSSENKLGQGGFGHITNGREIEVKRLIRGLEGGMVFKNEVSLLTRLQHKNLVKLLGFCNERDEEILVYEFVPNSSLDYFFFGGTLKRSYIFIACINSKRNVSFLTWEVRFKIIEGVARGLVYLHEDSQLKIIPRDLKASNILLDAEMNPKVADFGTAMLLDTDETS
ncbi:unnamed protein product [Brassica oleracea]